jgi:hypothetical protein
MSDIVDIPSSLCSNCSDARKMSQSLAAAAFGTRLVPQPVRLWALGAGGLVFQRRPYTRNLPFAKLEGIRFGSVRGVAGRGDITVCSCRRVPAGLPSCWATTLPNGLWPSTRFALGSRHRRRGGCFWIITCRTSPPATSSRFQRSLSVSGTCSSCSTKDISTASLRTVGGLHHRYTRRAA